MMTIGSLFAGYGGLDLATEAAFGARTAWVSEIDPGACKVLAHRFPDAPNLGDITTIDWATTPPVDIITGGSPCQDLSTAGRRAGMTDGTRSNLWVQMREAIAHVQPRYVVWENVRGAFTADAVSDVEWCPGCMGDDPAEPNLRALLRVLGDLSALGYDTEWRGLRASEVGACHQRFRVFILAWRRDAADADGAGLQGQRDPEGAAPARRYGHAEPGAGGPDLAMLPTPRASDTNGAGVHGTGGPDLRTIAGMLPTPRATRGGSSTETAELLPTPTTEPATGNGHARNLGKEVQLLPTPVVTDSSNARNATSGRKEGSQHHGGTTLGDVAHLGQFGQYAAVVARQESAFGYPAPSPTEPAAKLLNRHGNPRSNPRLSVRFAEWMMGLPAGWITDVPGVTRNEALRACGNGVVPQHAHAALIDMLTTITRGRAA